MINQATCQNCSEDKEVIDLSNFPIYSEIKGTIFEIDLICIDCLRGFIKRAERMLEVLDES